MTMERAVCLNMVRSPVTIVWALVDGAFNMEMTEMVTLVACFTVVWVSGMKRDLFIGPSSAGLYLLDDMEFFCCEGS